MIDRASRWPEAIPINDITAASVSEVMFREWVSRFGVPETITSDQGRQFESALYSNLLKLFGCKKARTTAYHPQANGKIERWHRALKTAIKCQEHGKWVDALPTIMLGLRTTLQSDTGVSASQLVTGESMRLPGDFFS